MDYLGPAWNKISDHLVAWIVVMLVFTFLVCLCGLGLLFTVNVTRLMKDCVENDTAPSVGGLFDFEHIGLDIVWLVLMLIAGVAGSMVPLIGSIAVTCLTFYTINLVAEGTDVMQAFKASFSVSTTDFVPILIFVIVQMIALTFAASLCVVPVFVVGPIFLAAQWMMFMDKREALQAVA